MPDPIALLDALEKLLGDISCWIKAQSHQEMHFAAMRVGHSYAQLRPDAIAQLRAALRSETETKVLRAALKHVAARYAYRHCGPGQSQSALGDAMDVAYSEYIEAVGALPPDELARLSGSPHSEPVTWELDQDLMAQWNALVEVPLETLTEGGKERRERLIEAVKACAGTHGGAS